MKNLVRPSRAGSHISLRSFATRHASIEFFTCNFARIFLLIKTILIHHFLYKFAQNRAVVDVAELNCPIISNSCPTHNTHIYIYIREKSDNTYKT